MVMVYRKDFLQGYEIDDTELADYQADGYTTSYKEAEAGSKTPGGSNYTGNVEDQSQDPSRTLDEGIQQANLLFKFMPESVRNEFANPARRTLLSIIIQICFISNFVNLSIISSL